MTINGIVINVLNLFFQYPAGYQKEKENKNEVEEETATPSKAKRKRKSQGSGKFLCAYGTFLFGIRTPVCCTLPGAMQ